MSNLQTDLWEENQQELQQEPASDKELQSEVLVEEQKEKLDLYKDILKENDNSLIDRMWSTVKPERTDEDDNSGERTMDDYHAEKAEQQLFDSVQD